MTPLDHENPYKVPGGPWKGFSCYQIPLINLYGMYIFAVQLKAHNPPIHLHLIFEISSLKNPVRQTGSKNPVQSRLKIQFVELDFSKLIFQKSSTDQQGECLFHSSCLHAVSNTRLE